MHSYYQSSHRGKPQKPPVNVTQPQHTTLDQTCTRFPCKARGVGGTHKSSTSFIEVPRNAVHGTVLSCNHPDCSGSGRRFRYCAVCEIPVAKRNFSARHSHDLIQDDESKPSSKRRRSESEGEASFSRDEQDENDGLTVVLTEEERQWLELYHNRPPNLDDENELKHWMDDVINVIGMNTSSDDEHVDSGDEHVDSDDEHITQEEQVE